MNEFDWMMTAVDHAGAIAAYRGGDQKINHDPIVSLRKFLKSEPYITDKGEVIPLDSDAVIDSIYANPRWKNKEIGKAIVQAVRSGMRKTTGGGIIKPMREPINCDGWCLVIKQAVRDYESKHRHTPSLGELWCALTLTPPKEWGITYNERQQELSSPDIEKPLPRAAFRKRYNRYFS